MRDLGDEVSRPGRDLAPQQELAQAWDQVSQERRSQGQSDAPALGQRQQGPDASQRSGEAQQKPGDRQGSGSAASSDAGAGGQPDDGSLGEGDGSPSSAQAPGGLGGTQPGSAFEPQGQAKRLDVQGRPVEVEVKPGRQPSRRPGDSESANGHQTDEVGAISAVSGQAPPPINSAAPAETNFVPSDRRQAVRDYFTPNEGR